MTNKIRIPALLRSLTNGQRELDVEGSTIREIIENIDKSYSGFRAKLLDDNGALKNFMNIFVNDRNIKTLNGVNTEVNPEDNIYILIAIAGG